MIWIVAFWHLEAYLAGNVKIQNEYTQCLTIGVLSTFTFISGFFLSRKRIVMYFPVYCFGLFGSQILKLSEKISVPFFLIGLVLSASSTISIVYFGSNLLTEIFVAFSHYILIIEISKLISFGVINKVFYLISYASMCAYLFHRQYPGLLKALIGDFNIFLAYLVIIPFFLLYVTLFRNCMIYW